MILPIQNFFLRNKNKKLLRDAISETKEKLQQLTFVQNQMEAGLANDSITQDQYDAWQREMNDYRKS